jgi:predicted nucleic acid-binding protein
VASFFFDSSAVVKRYVLETGSAWVDSISNSAAGHRIFIVRVSGVEVVSALVRKASALSHEDLRGIRFRS